MENKSCFYNVGFCASFLFTHFFTMLHHFLTYHEHILTFIYVIEHLENATMKRQARLLLSFTLLNEI